MLIPQNPAAGVAPRRRIFRPGDEDYLADGVITGDSPASGAAAPPTPPPPSLPISPITGGAEAPASIRPRQADARLTAAGVDSTSGELPAARPLDQALAGLTLEAPEDVAASVAAIRPRRVSEVPGLGTPAHENAGSVRPRNARVAGSAGAMIDQLKTLQNNPARDQNGRGRSMILNMLHAMSEQARAVSEGSARSGRPVDEYGFASIFGAGAGGAAGGGLNPAVDEKRRRQFRMDELTGQIGQQLQIERYQGEQRRADEELELKRLDYGIRARDLDRKAAEDEQRRIDRDRRAFFSRLRAKKGMPLDPQDIEDGVKLGFEIDPDEWLNAKDNIVTAVVTDPNDPTKTNLVRINKLTGEQWRQDQKGFQQPVNSSTGMTNYQGGSLELGQERFGETKRRNAVTEAQAWRRIEQGDERFERQLSADDRERYDEARKIIREINDLEAKANSSFGRRAEEARAKAEHRKRDLEVNFGDLRQKAEDGEQTQAPKGRIPRSELDKIRTQNPHLRGLPDEQVIDALRREGYEVH